MKKLFINNKIIYFLLLFLLALSINKKVLVAQVEPKPPKLPTEPIINPERDARGDKPSKSSILESFDTKENLVNKDSQPKEKYFLKLTLCDGRQVSGFWDLTDIKKEITFRHVKDGIVYTKTLPLSAIGKVIIQTWNSELQKREKDGDAYKMKPQKVSIQTKSGELFIKEDGLEGTQFSVITIENNYGKASLYSLWIDMYYKSGKWFSNLKPIDPKETREDCYKDVWKTLELL